MVNNVMKYMTACSLRDFNLCILYIVNQNLLYIVLTTNHVHTTFQFTEIVLKTEFKILESLSAGAQKYISEKCY